MNRWNDALSDACACERLRPQWQRTHECKGAALEALGRFDEALAEFRKALARDPGSESLQGAVAELSRVAAGGAQAQQPLSLSSVGPRDQPTVSPHEQGPDAEIDTDFCTPRDPTKRVYGSVWAETAREGRDRRPPYHHVDLGDIYSQKVHSHSLPTARLPADSGEFFRSEGEGNDGGDGGTETGTQSSNCPAGFPPVVPGSSTAAQGGSAHAREEEQSAGSDKGGDLGPHESLVPLLCTSVFSAPDSGICIDTSASASLSISMPILSHYACFCTGAVVTEQVPINTTFSLFAAGAHACTCCHKHARSGPWQTKQLKQQSGLLRPRRQTVL